MLLPYLYKITSYSLSYLGVHEFTIVINSEDPLFKGHFPFRPILPGVCTMQIIKECICSILSRDLYFSNITQCKFVGMIDPLIDNAIAIKIECKNDEFNNVLINASVSSSNVIVCKLKATLSEFYI